MNRYRRADRVPLSRGTFLAWTTAVVAAVPMSCSAQQNVARRTFLLWIGAAPLLATLPARAQERRMRRIGYFTGSAPRNNAAWLAAFREGMAALRWVEGRDYVIDARYGYGNPQATLTLATELVASQPDLILTVGDEVTRLLAERTKTIPIVFASAQDPVGSGIAASLQRPGGNATGLTSLARELSAKRLQLLREAFPRVAKIVMLFEPDNVGSVAQAKETQEAAASLAVRVTLIELRQAADIEPAFKRGAALGAQAYMVASGFLSVTHRKAITDRVLRSRVPTMFYGSQSPEADELMWYGPSEQDRFRRAATYVDKILKGAKPGELPVEQPTKFEFAVNMRTAKAMGLTIPRSILLRADRVIE